MRRQNKNKQNPLQKKTSSPRKKDEKKKKNEQTKQTIKKTYKKQSNKSRLKKPSTPDHCLTFIFCKQNI